MRLGEAEIVFRYADSFRAATDLEGYEQLILEAVLPTNRSSPRPPP
jgi:hypothetical protein